jgi:peroxiredoxin Q/BCP
MKPLQILAAIVAPIGLAIAATAAEPINIGAALPAVTAKNQDGQEVKLAEAGAEGWTLVYFYPKADTPGCTRQACSLRDSYATLTEKKVKVFGVSMDDVAAQKAFQEKHKLPFPLLADKEAKVADAFGVPHSMGFTSRQAYLFKDGKLVWRDLKASTDQQAADVLKEIGEAK